MLVNLAAVWLLSASFAQAASLQISQSHLAVVTQKEGIASGLAHRHIIVASEWRGSLQLNGLNEGPLPALSALTSARATISVPVKSMIVDSPEAAKGIVEVLTAAKIWNEKNDELSPDNATKVRDNMLDESQLDADKFAAIEGEGDFSKCEKLDEKSMQCALNLKLTIRGRSVAKNLKVIVKQDTNQLVAEFAVPFKFTDFAIKPYTTMMGAIGVSDEFFLAARLVATTL